MIIAASAKKRARAATVSIVIGSTRKAVLDAFCPGRVGGVAQLDERRVRRSAEAGSSPRCGKGFFSQGQLSVQTLLTVSGTVPVYNRMH